MKTPPAVPDEAGRLDALRRYRILDTPPESALDDLVSLAAHICGTPISQISLIDENRQWIKAAVGVDERKETARDIAFCAHALVAPDILVINDAAGDARFADNPLVTGDPHIRFYAGVPLVTEAGFALGAVCVIDTIPRELTAAQLNALRALGRQVMAQLDLRRQTEELRVSEERLFKVFSSSPVAVAINRLHERTFVDVNSQFTTLTGWTREDAIGRTNTDLALVEEGTAGAIRDGLGSRTLDERELIVTTRTGARIHVLTGTVVVEFRGEPHAISTFVDITHRKEAEDALRTSEERLRLALDAARMGTFDWDMVRDRITCSNWQEVLRGFAPDDFDGTYAAFARRVHPEDLADLKAEIARSTEVGKALYREFRVIWPDETVHWIGARGELHFDGDGSPVRMRGAIVEITDRKEAETQLWLSHERFQMVARATNDAVWDWDLRTNALWWNEGYEALFGYSPRNTQPSITSWMDHIHPDDSARVLDGIHAAVRRADNAWSDEYRYVRSNGSVANVFDRGYIIRDENRVPIRMIGAMQDVTARKRAEVDAERLALRLTLATDAASIGIWDWDIPTDAWYASPTYFTMLGYDPGQHGNDRDFWINRLHPSDREMVRDKINSAVSGRADEYGYEARILHADGSYRWIEVTGRVLSHDESGKATRLLGVRIDVTERKRAAEEREHMLARITDAFVSLDSAWRYTFVNARAAELLGRSAADLIGTHVWTEFPAGASHSFRETAERAMARQEASSMEGYYPPLDRWLETRFYPSPDGLSVYFDDITSRKQSERHIQRLNRVYAVLSAINQVIVRIKDREVMLASACEIAVDIGQFRMAWIGLNQPEGRFEIAAHAGASSATVERLHQLLGGDTRPVECAFTESALATGKHAVCNHIASQPDSVTWRAEAVALDYQSMVSLPLWAGGVVVGTFNLYSGESNYFDAEEMTLLDELAEDVGFALQVHARDAERARIEHALQESEDRFRQLAENIQEAFWITEIATGRMLYVSPAYETIWGRPAEALYTSPGTWKDALHPDDLERIVNAVETRQARGDYDETYRVVRPDGTVRWVRDRAFPVRDAGGSVVRVVGTAEDITDARQLEEQFRQSQKMEAVGQLAGGVAHDFNNILAAIMMQADLAASIADPPPETRELLEDIKSATERAANLTRQLLAFSRRQVMQPRDVDLNEAVTDLSKMLQRILGEDVRLKLDLHPRALMTRADPGMLDQVLMNLVINSRDAMPDGGTLSVETSARVLSAMEASSIPEAEPGRYVSLRVRDTGTGIAAEHLPRIFEPFYTTKEPGKGTGLGLATVFGIVRQHGGSIVVASEPDKGATFEVLLPVSALRSGSRGSGFEATESRGGTETILVVEDESSVRTLTRIVLERAGYTVLEAADGRAALRVWQEQGARVDMLLTDMVMPGGIGGRDLAARLVAERPGLAVVFTSGYSADIAGKELSLEEGRNFIQKPSGPHVLLETVRRCLEKRPGRQAP